MKEKSITQSRKKFLFWGAITISSATLCRFIPGIKSKEKPATVKMLTEDGSLVEIDQVLLTPGKKITNLELQQWIKNKPGQ